MRETKRRGERESGKVERLIYFIEPASNKPPSLCPKAVIKVEDSFLFPVLCNLQSKFQNGVSTRECERETERERERERERK